MKQEHCNDQFALCGHVKRNNCNVRHGPMCNIDEMHMDTCSHTRECSNQATR
jgi:hypothetical protein